jgi:hypothetical protein
MPEAIRAAIKNNQDDELAVCYVPELLRTWMAITPDEMARIKLAQDRVATWRRFEHAFSADSDDQIISAYDSVLTGYSRFGNVQRQRWELAKARVEVRDKVRDALKTGDERSIAAVDTAAFGDDLRLTPKEKAQIATARACVALPTKVREALLTQRDAAIDQVYDRQLVRTWMDFSNDERERIALAQQREAALRRFRQALDRADEQEIVRVYDPILDKSTSITAAERGQLDLARRCVAMKRQLSIALTTRNDEQLVACYDESLVRPWMQIDDSMLAHIQKAQNRVSLAGEVLRQLDQNNIERALALEESAGFPLENSRLTRAKRMFIAHQDPRQLEATLSNGQLRATWRWPDSKYVRTVAVTWRTDSYPTKPEEAGTTIHRINRKSYEQNGCMLQVPAGTNRLYVRLFAAMSVQDRNNGIQVLYSNSVDPTARQEVIPRVVLHCQLTPKKDRRCVLELTTKDQSALPKIVVVRTKERLALHLNDGDQIFQFDRQQPPQSSLQATIDVTGWPRHSVLRVFASHNERDWYAASDRIDVPNS